MTQTKAAMPLAETARLLWGMMRTKDRVTSLMFCTLQFACSLLEVIGIGLIVPAVALLSDSPPGQSSRAIEWVRGVAGDASQGHLALITIIMLCGLLLAKAVTIGLLAIVQGRFVFGLQERLSEQLFGAYLNQPWSAHAHRNTAESIRNCTTEVTQVLGVLLTAIGMVGDLLLVAGLSILVLWAAPIGSAIVAAIVTPPVFVYLAMMRDRISSWGQRRQQAEGRRVSVIHQGLAALKELKILGREDRMLQAYRLPNCEASTVGKWYYLIGQLPRIGLESLAMIGIVGWVAFAIATGQPPSEVIASVVLVVAVSVRMLPAVQRIIVSLQILRFGSSSIELVSRELRTAAPQEEGDSERLDAHVREIRVRGLSFRHAGAGSDVLRDINLTIDVGSAVGIVGPSGAGKSTLGDLLMGMLRAGKGDVAVDGQAVSKVQRQWRKRIGYVPQSVAIMDDTIRRNVALGCRDDEIDDDKVWRALEGAHVSTDVRCMQEGLDTHAGESGARLSGGQRQRLGIARALYVEPTVLVLDEATGALDAETESQIIGTLEDLKGKVTIIVITHREAPLRICDRIFEVSGSELRQIGGRQSLEASGPTQPKTNDR